MSLKVLGFLAVSIGAIVGLTVGMAMWTIQVWLPPMAPLLYLASVFLVLFLAFGAGWFVMTRRELVEGIGAEGESAEERGLRRLIMLTAQVLLAAVALGVASMWNVEKVRAYFVDFTGQTHVRLEQPLRDQSGLVRLAACETMFQRGWVYRSRNALVAALNPYPHVAQRCLETARQNDWKGFRPIATDLGDGWEAEMTASGDMAAPRVCQYAPWTPAVDMIAERTPDIRLLKCSLTANSNQVRQCCADALVERGTLTQRLESPESFTPEQVDEVFSALVEHGFAADRLDPEQRKIVGMLNLDAATSRRNVIELGCSMLEPSKAQPELLRGFSPVIESEACTLTNEEQIEYTTGTAWVRLCGEIREQGSTKAIEDVVCESVQGARVDKAIVHAALRVHEAIRSPFRQREADFVSAGIGAADRFLAGGGGGGEKKQKFHRQMGQILLDQKNDPTVATCEKRVFRSDYNVGITSFTGESEVVRTFECERRPDIAPEDYYRQYLSDKPGAGGARSRDPFGMVKKGKLEESTGESSSKISAAKKKFQEFYDAELARIEANE